MSFECPPSPPRQEGGEGRVDSKTHIPAKDKTRFPSPVELRGTIGNIVTRDGTFRVSRLIRIQWFVDERNRRLYLDINGRGMDR